MNLQEAEDDQIQEGDHVFFVARHGEVLSGHVKIVGQRTRIYSIMEDKSQRFYACIARDAYGSLIEVAAPATLLDIIRTWWMKLQKKAL